MSNQLTGLEVFTERLLRHGALLVSTSEGSLIIASQHITSIAPIGLERCLVYLSNGVEWLVHKPFSDLVLMYEKAMKYGKDYPSV